MFETKNLTEERWHTCDERQKYLNEKSSEGWQLFNIYYLKHDEDRRFTIYIFSK